MVFVQRVLNWIDYIVSTSPFHFQLNTIKMKRVITLSMALCLFASCSGVKRIGNGAYLAKYDAEKRGSLVYRDKSDKVHIISEVQPDVAISSILQLSNKLSDGKGLTAEQTMSLTRTVAQLGERTEAVNILRDALHRLSEIKNNSGEIDTSTKEIFLKVLGTVQDIVLADKLKAEKEKIQAQKEYFEETKQLYKDND